MASEQRPIDANELVAWFKKAGAFFKGTENCEPVTYVIGKIIDHIEAMPTVDTVEVVRDYEGSLHDALESIVWYDGHYEWLKELRDDMEKHKTDAIYRKEFEVWHTEEHVIWMLLVGMFGEWGTSIRSGWIDRIGECVNFIDALCGDLWKEAQHDVNT